MAPKALPVNNPLTGKMISYCSIGSRFFFNHLHLQQALMYKMTLWYQKSEQTGLQLLAE
jgi:hypothetical protein